MSDTRYRAVVTGSSAGGMESLSAVLGPLPADYAIPVFVAQHLHPNDGGLFAEHLQNQTALKVVEAEDKTRPRPGHVYVAPANYHMLVARDGSLALSVDPPVNWSRPSIDVLFDSAAWAFRERLIAVILSGANSDGAKGIQRVRTLGGIVMAQDPVTAECPVMPRFAIDAAGIEMVLPPKDIAVKLVKLADEKPGHSIKAPDSTRTTGERT